MPENETIYAFILTSGFQLKAPSASDQDLEKIRSEHNTPGADVQVILPKNWDPPKMASLDEQKLGANMMEILSRVQDWFFIHAYHSGMTDTISGGVIVRPKDGKKVFFTFKKG